MPTFADLTKQLSQDITRNEHERTKALETLEIDRVKPLQALPGSAALLTAQNAAIRDAEKDHADTLADVAADRREADRKAAAKRRADEDAAEAKLRTADDAADAALRTAEKNARDAFEASSQAIDKGSLPQGQKVLARAEARRVMDAAIKKAQEAHAEARLRNGDVLTDERRNARSTELATSASSLAEADARRKEAERVLERAVAIAAHDLQRALAEVAGAPAVIAEFAAKRDAIHRTFDAQDEAIRAEFRKKRQELGF